MTSVRVREPGLVRTPPGTGIRWLAWAMVVWCVGFAVVNVGFEASGHLDHGVLAGYSTGLSVMEWLVVALKLLGAGTALLTVSERPRWVSATAPTVLVWGAFALLALYSAGNLVQLVRLLVGEPERVTPRSLAYVLFFAVAAAAYGLLARSYSRRSGTGRRWALIGAVGGPVVFVLVLFAIPAALGAAGLLPG